MGKWSFRGARSANPESRDSPGRNCAPEVWSFGPSRNDGRRRQPAGLASLTLGLGLAAALGLAGLAEAASAGAAAGLAAASGLALAWRTAAGLAGFALVS